MKNNTVENVIISNTERIIYPKQKITKLDVVMYYKNISFYMLPYIKNRLLSVIRCHNGIDKDCFFKKHPTTETKQTKSISINKEKYFIINPKKQLITQVQMGSLEFHSWNCRISNIEKPDIMIFDLDPDESIKIDFLRQAVLLTKKVLDSLKLKSFLKTSGGKGYHIVVPFNTKCNYETFNEFAKNVAEYLESTYPEIFTTNSRKNKRKNKIFIDYLRNKRGATCIAPYSLRARNGATVSVPISWSKLNYYTPNYFDIYSTIKYAKTHNPWKEFFDVKQMIK